MEAAAAGKKFIKAAALLLSFPPLPFLSVQFIELVDWEFLWSQRSSFPRIPSTVWCWPMLNTDLESDGTYPPAVEAFRQKILEADSILLASAEYNYSVTECNRLGIKTPNVCVDKPAAIVSTGGSFGGGLSQYHLRQMGVYLDFHFINKPEFFLNTFQPPPKFDADGNLIDEDAMERILNLLLSLLAFSRRLQGK